MRRVIQLFDHLRTPWLSFAPTGMTNADIFCRMAPLFMASTICNCVMCTVQTTTPKYPLPKTTQVFCFQFPKRSCFLNFNLVFFIDEGIPVF